MFTSFVLPPHFILRKLPRQVEAAGVHLAHAALPQERARDRRTPVLAPHAFVVVVALLEALLIRVVPLAVVLVALLAARAHLEGAVLLLRRGGALVLRADRDVLTGWEEGVGGGRLERSWIGGRGTGGGGVQTLEARSEDTGWLYTNTNANEGGRRRPRRRNQRSVTRPWDRLHRRESHEQQRVHTAQELYIPEGFISRAPRAQREEYRRRGRVHPHGTAIVPDGGRLGHGRTQ